MVTESNCAESNCSSHHFAEIHPTRAQIRLLLLVSPVFSCPAAYISGHQGHLHDHSRPRLHPHCGWTSQFRICVAVRHVARPACVPFGGSATSTGAGCCIRQRQMSKYLQVHCIEPHGTGLPTVPKGRVSTRTPAVVTVVQ